MKLLLSFAVMVTAVVIGLTNSHHRGIAGELRVGFSKVDITPPLPTAMAGYYSERISTETHDPLWCRTTLLELGDVRVALVTLDLISNTRWLVEETRKRIDEASEIKIDGVLISATHSHTGPIIFNPESSRALVQQGNNTTTERYMVELPGKICDSVLLAIKDLAPANVERGVGEERNLAFNRRHFMTDGSVGWNPGKLNPRVVRPAGPTDDSVPLIVFTGANSKPRGLLCSYAIHLDTVGGTQWSADVPYTLIQSLEKVYGSDCHVQYSTGTCGDINHVDVNRAFAQKGHAESARIGTRLAGAVLRTMRDVEKTETLKLHVTSEMVEIETAAHTPERLEWAKGVAEKAKGTPSPPFRDMVEAFRILDVDMRKGLPYQLEVQVISLGDKIAWVSLPGEIFVQLGIAIKEGSPFEVTSIHELANGSIGYIPTRQAYPQGNYEVLSARCAAGSGERLVDSALKQLVEHQKLQSAR